MLPVTEFDADPGQRRGLGGVADQRTDLVAAADQLFTDIDTVWPVRR